MKSEQIDIEKSECLLGNNDKASSTKQLGSESSLRIIGGAACLSAALFALLFSWHLSLAHTASQNVSFVNHNDMLTQNNNVHKKWPHPPKPKKLDHGKVMYLTSQAEDGSLVYKRDFTAPCNYGILVFNIGPAPEYAPYAYDVYQDAYAFSDNQGLCPLYPSWKATQTADYMLWDPSDPTEQRVPLGAEEHKISSRVYVPPKSKKGNTARGGDFIILQKGNFYNPFYYQRLQEHVRSFPPDMTVAEMEHAVHDITAEVTSE